MNNIVFLISKGSGMTFATTLVRRFISKSKYKYITAIYLKNDVDSHILALSKLSQCTDKTMIVFIGHSIRGGLCGCYDQKKPYNHGVFIGLENDILNGKTIMCFSCLSYSFLTAYHDQYELNGFIGFEKDIVFEDLEFYGKYNLAGKEVEKLCKFHSRNILSKCLKLMIEMDLNVSQTKNVFKIVAYQEILHIISHTATPRIKLKHERVIRYIQQLIVNIRSDDDYRS